MSQRSGRHSAAFKKVEVEHKMSFPNLSTFTQGSVSVKDLAIGAVAGLGGIAGFRYLVNKALASSPLPAVVIKALNMPVVAGALTGVGLYLAQKGNPRAKSHLIGATLAGVTAQAWVQLQSQFAQLQDYVAVGLDGYRGMGMLVNEPRGLNGMGMLVDESRDSRQNLAELTQVAIDGADEDGI